jgi:polysaccharide pyruvyl transferase WcaK-like protein
LKTISVLDTDITSSNLGNEIIMEAVNDVLNEIFFDDFIIRIQCTDLIGKMSKKYIGLSNYSFIGGSNLLTSEMNVYKQIGFQMLDSFKINEMILFGVGWWQYQKEPNLFTKIFLKNLLSRKNIHSVRDFYSENKLKKLGITNVLNTSCPSTWVLTKAHCAQIPKIKSPNVVFTLTDYNLDHQNDKNFINILKNNYENIYFWPQGLNDIEYLDSLKINDSNRINILPPKLKAFDDLLKNNDIDYIGTRLHGGIRAMQKKKRTLIISIDNRASEISSDIGLNVAARGSENDLKNFINHSFETSVIIPEKNISIWKNQF